MKRICESCGRSIERDEVSYRLRIEMFADPSPPQFTDEDLEADLEAEMRAILEQMEDCDAGEAEAQVYEAYLFTLCPRCRASLHEELKRRNLSMD